MPTIVPLGSTAVIVRFADTLSPEANAEAIAFAERLERDLPEGVEEIAPGLVSVLVRTGAGTDLWRLSGELRLRVGRGQVEGAGRAHDIAVVYDGDDLGDVAALLEMDVATFVDVHNERSLRVLATGFAPGFVYCGFHPERLVVPRRREVRPVVPAGTVLFAAGQTAIAATPIRTGWNVIGKTLFHNFDPEARPPTLLAPGDIVRFSVAA